jgi:hypothetical protein
MLHVIPLLHLSTCTFISKKTESLLVWTEFHDAAINMTYFRPGP